MARNSEKAMTTLARWRAAHIENKKEKEIRPYLATECDNLEKALIFRRQILGEITKNFDQIQNAGLGEFKLRDLNDLINKLFREKRHWEIRIKELGGPDFRRNMPKDRDGREVPGSRGYRYFGATKDLPGVRELFEQAPPAVQEKSRGELMKFVDADYYGYRDEDDGILLRDEAEKELEVRRKKIEEARKKISEGSDNNTAASQTRKKLNEDSDDEFIPSGDSNDHMLTYIAHVNVPTQKEMEQALVLRKKREILDKYVSESLQLNEEDTKQLLGL